MMPYDRGEVRPLSGMIHPTGVALDPAHGEVITSDSVRNGIITYLGPDLFDDSKGH